MQTSIAGRFLPKLCNHNRFRNHPVAYHRKPYGYLYGFTKHHKGNSVVIQAALLATVCDVPATAKLVDF